MDKKKPNTDTVREQIREAFNFALCEWGGNFTVDVDVAEWADCGTMAVTVTNRHFGSGFEFVVRVSDEGGVEFDLDDDCWMVVNGENVFASMWFDAMERAKEPR